MDILQQIQGAFPDRGVPEPDALVVFDEFDQPAKESAVQAFSGKTRRQIGELVGKGPSGIEGLWGIEDLEVLEPVALQYYLVPFLQFLIAAEYAKPDEFSFFLCYHLSEILRRRGVETFTADQRRVVAEIAAHLADRSSESDEWASDVRSRCRSLMERLTP